MSGDQSSKRRRTLDDEAVEPEDVTRLDEARRSLEALQADNLTTQEALKVIALALSESLKQSKAIRNTMITEIVTKLDNVVDEISTEATRRTVMSLAPMLREIKNIVKTIQEKDNKQPPPRATGAGRQGTSTASTDRRRQGATTSTTTSTTSSTNNAQQQGQQGCNVTFTTSDKEVLTCLSNAVRQRFIDLISKGVLGTTQDVVGLIAMQLEQQATV